MNPPWDDKPGPSAYGAPARAPQRPAPAFPTPDELVESLEIAHGLLDHIRGDEAVEEVRDILADLGERLRLGDVPGKGPGVPVERWRVTYGHGYPQGGKAKHGGRPRPGKGRR